MGCHVTKANIKRNNNITSISTKEIENVFVLPPNKIVYCWGQGKLQPIRMSTILSRRQQQQLLSSNSGR